VIVSNASPLIVLLKINKLSILKELFEKIVVPEAVYEEITAKENERLVFDRVTCSHPLRDVGFLLQR
jgi:predicted nucleic acid-binding protein